MTIKELLNELVELIDENPNVDFDDSTVYIERPKDNYRKIKTVELHKNDSQAYLLLME